MAEQNSNEDLFFKFLSQYKFHEEDIDRSVLDRHTVALQTLSVVGKSGISVFDISKRQVVFYSSNFGELLGYSPADYGDTGQQFFYERFHPEDKLKLQLNGVSVLKLFNDFSRDEKLAHKVISEYRMLNAQGKYVRLIEQYQVLELDKTGQVWLLISIVDISPNQEELTEAKSQFLNFKTGNFIPLDEPKAIRFELTKREIEILKFVKDGLLSKEISNRLSISLHTVNTHRQRFLEKLGANNSFEAVLFASKLGLLQ